MIDSSLKIVSNLQVARDSMMLRLECPEKPLPGQFVQVEVPGFYLRRPFAVADYQDGILTVVYKIVGQGTAFLAGMQPGQSLSVLHFLGNGFDVQKTAANPCLIGGSVGVAPLLYLARFVPGATVVMGFRSAADVMLVPELEALGCKVVVCTEDGSAGVKGFVTGALPAGMDYYYACGPMPMLRAIASATCVPGQMSLEARMGCGFGACMGCSIQTADGPRRVCKDGPVFKNDELIW